MTHQTVRLGKYWKLFSATLIKKASICQAALLSKIDRKFLRWVGGGVGMLFVVSFRIIKK